MSIRSTIGLALLALAVTGCGEKPQTSGAAKKVDAKAWEASKTTHLANGWKGSDQAAWEAQMNLRAQGQNEYSRVAAAVPVAAPTKTP
jgi:hypothetical protein